jgi:hypothetical protein
LIEKIAKHLKKSKNAIKTEKRNSIWIFAFPNLN